MGLGKLLQKGISLAVKYNAELCLAGSIFGVALTGYEAYKAAKRVSKALDEAYEQKVEEALKTAPGGLTEPVEGLTVKEKVEVAWKPCIRPVISGLTTVGMIVANDRIHRKRYALLGAFCKSVQTVAFEDKDTLERIKEVMGAEEYDKVRKQVSDSRLKEMKESDIPENKSPHYTLIRDELTGSTWWGSVDKVEEAIAKHQRQWSDDAGEDYYDFLIDAGASTNEIGKSASWFFYGANGNGNTVIPGLKTVPNVTYINGVRQYCTHITYEYSPLIQ